MTMKYWSLNSLIYEKWLFVYEYIYIYIYIIIGETEKSLN